MAQYEFWSEFLQSKANTYEGFRDRMLQVMPRYYHASRNERKEMRTKALGLLNGMSDEQRIDFYRGAYRPTI